MSQSGFMFQIQCNLFYVNLQNMILIRGVSRWFIFTARKRSLRRLCFYTCLSVILFTGGCLPHPPEQTSPPQGADTPRSRHPPGAETPLGVDTHPPGADTPTQCMLGDKGNKRAVPILLECILVLFETSINSQNPVTETILYCHKDRIQLSMPLFYCYIDH